LKEVEKKFLKVYRRLTPFDLQRMSDENQPIIDEDFLNDPVGIKKSGLFLNYYSQEGLITVLEELGIFDILRTKGFDDLRLVIRVDDICRSHARVYFGGIEDPSHLLIELVLREGSIRSLVKGGDLDLAAGGQFTVLIVEWLCLQNPTATFSPYRPPLPGQAYPGLGIGYEMLELLVLMGMRAKKDGIMNRPQYYHNARVYHEKFRFYNPVREGRFIALVRDTGDDDLTDVSWAIHHGCLRDARTNEKVIWQGGNQIYPLSKELEESFGRREYKSLVWETAGNTRYRIDWKHFPKRMIQGMGDGTVHQA
jgi:hypothetical protein